MRLFYKKAMKWLASAGLIHNAYAVQKGNSPLKNHANLNAYKVYGFDIGLVGAMANSPVEGQVQEGRFIGRYSNGFISNYVAQQLKAQSGVPLYFWKSKGGKAELDFLYEQDDGIYPVEINTGLNTKSKRLQSYAQQFSPPAFIRSNLLNFKKAGDIYNIPLYAVTLLPKYISKET